MKQEQKDKVVPMVVLIIGGAALLTLTYWGYYGVSKIIAGVFENRNPEGVHAEEVRFYMMIVLAIIYVFATGLLKNDFLKSLIFIPPFTLALVAILMKYAETPLVGLASTILLTFLALGVFRMKRRNWMYYFTAVLSLISALVYAIPKL